MLDQTQSYDTLDFCFELLLAIIIIYQSQSTQLNIIVNYELNNTMLKTSTFSQQLSGRKFIGDSKLKMKSIQFFQ
jgi:hypothetical protein